MVENRWMPPSPHREQVMRFIDEGLARIVERGHNRPPLLVFEDGGAIELPQVRYRSTRRGMQLAAAEEAPSDRGMTRYYDVCGSIDELKGHVAEKGALDADVLACAEELLDDTRYMLGRMQKRRRDYCSFFEGVRAAVKEAETIAGPERERGDEAVAVLLTYLDDHREDGSLHMEEFFALAEAVRDVAGELEHCLAAYKEQAMRIGSFYAEIKGGRTWHVSDRQEKEVNDE